MQQAEAEGLTLLRSASNKSGFKGVSFTSGKSKPYKAEVNRRGKLVYLGGFATPEEAALSYAQAAAAIQSAAAQAAGPSSATATPLRAAPAASPVTPRTKRTAQDGMVSDEDAHSPATAKEEEAIAQVEDGSDSGYSCVVPAPKHAPKPWAAVMDDDLHIFSSTSAHHTYGYFTDPHTAVLWLLRRLDDPAEHDGSKKQKHTS